MTLVFQEQRLYRRTVGRRRVIYTFGILVGLAVAVTALLVGLGVVPGTEAKYVAVCFVFPAVFVPFLALWDNPGEKRTWLERLSAFGFVWLVLGCIIEAGWELTWVVTDIIGVIHHATADDRWVWVWWVYTSADTRYLIVPSDATVFSLEVMAGICGPLLIYTLWTLRRGHYIRANWMALLLLWPLAYADFPFMIAEWHNGFRHIEGGWFGFWIIFWGLNIPWVIAPVPLIWGKILEIRYWYQRENFLQFRDAGGDVTILPASDDIATPSWDRTPVA
jgi:hypothetical protein